MHSTKENSAVITWLYVCCGLVFLMIIVGAITRLTESGLSIVEWRPLIGALPPMNEEEWQRVYELYKLSPEFEKKHFWMDIEDFKNIFFWEWFHRFLGRLIGIVYALPFLFFLIRGWIPQGYKLKFFGLLVLGGAQGFMGWYMVKSGLVDIPSVSHYRLTAHLSLALLIYGLMFWIAQSLKDLGTSTKRTGHFCLYRQGWVTLGLLMITIFWGAYTAGLDAGLVYNDTFPKMGETWIPSEIWFYKPVWVNFFENPAGVQFVHRWLAMLTGLALFGLSIRAMHTGYKDLRFAMLGFFVFIQIGLGIFTLLSGVNIVLAVSHQAGAVLLLTLLLACMHKLRV